MLHKSFCKKAAFGSFFNFRWKMFFRQKFLLKRQINCHFLATFRPKQSLVGIYFAEKAQFFLVQKILVSVQGVIKLFQNRIMLALVFLNH